MLLLCSLAYASPSVMPMTASLTPSGDSAAELDVVVSPKAGTMMAALQAALSAASPDGRK